MKWNLKISDLFVIFIWISFLFGTISQLFGSESIAHCFLLASLCFLAIVFLGFKLKLRTGTTSSWVLTGILGITSSFLFFITANFSSGSTINALFTFISLLAIGISFALIFFRFASGPADHGDRRLTMGQLLEYLAPSGCSAIYLTCYVGLNLSARTQPHIGIILGPLIFIFTAVIAFVLWVIERKTRD